MCIYIYMYKYTNGYMAIAIGFMDENGDDASKFPESLYSDNPKRIDLSM